MQRKVTLGEQDRTGTGCESEGGRVSPGGFLEPAWQWSDDFGSLHVTSITEMMMRIMMITTTMMMKMMMMGMMVMMTMCFQLPLQRLADSRGSALGALFRTHYTGCCGLRSTAGERQ